MPNARELAGQLIRFAGDRGSLLPLVVVIVVAFNVIGWWTDPSVESASTPTKTCGIGIAPCETRAQTGSTRREGLADASNARFRSVIPISARGIDLTGSRFDRISVIIPASGGSVTASDRSFTLTVPEGIARDPAGNARNVKLVVEQITPPEDNQMVGFWAARALMTYEDGWLVDPQTRPVEVTLRFRRNDLTRTGAGSSPVFLRTLVNGVQWSPADSTIDMTRFEARMNTDLLSSFALVFNRQSPGGAVAPPPSTETSSPTSTRTSQPDSTRAPTVPVASSTPVPSSSSIASNSPTQMSGASGTVSATATTGVAATMTVTQLPAGSRTTTPTQLAGGTATTIATQLSSGTATFTLTLIPTSTFTLTPKPTFTSTSTPTFTSTTSATPVLGGQATPNTRFGFIIGSITDDTAISNVMSQTGAGAWIPYDDLRVSGPNGRVNLIRTGAQRRPPAFDAVIDEVARGRPGAYWLIGNEPNVPGQDYDGRVWTNGAKDYASLRGAATRYVEAFRHYRTLVRTADPTAHIVFGNFLNFDSTCEACGGFFSTREYLDEVQLAFQRDWNEEIPADVIWGIHAYVIDWLHLPMIDNGIVSREISLLRTYIDTTPSRRGSPIWLTEFGVIWGYPSRCSVAQKIASCPGSPYADQMAESYLSTTLDWLIDNALAMHIDRWFLFANYALPEPFATVYGGISLVDGPGPTAQISRVGRIYRDYSQRAR